MIKIKEVVSEKEKKAFVKFPFGLYKNSPYWVPPIISEELRVFDNTKNPILKDAEVKLFLAYKNNAIVGRIAAIANWIEINEQNVKKMRFGWFDFIDDLSVSRALLEKISEIGNIHNLKYMEGPVGFSNLDKVGVLTHGFDVIGTMISWYNHPYYAAHLETHNFSVEKEYLEYKHAFSDIKIEKFKRLSEIIEKRYKLKPLNFSSTKEVMVYADQMFDLFNLSYSKLSSFVKITEPQKNYMKKKFLNFINPEYIKFVVDTNDKLVAFAVVMPSFAKALQKIKGKLFPFGFLKILKAKKSKTVNFFLIGVHPDYQNKGVHALIFSEYHKTFEAKGISECRRTPELSDNLEIHKLWRNFNPKLIKKRCTYRKRL
jgi:GNAT superfamily N-acetyltransferase